MKLYISCITAFKKDNVFMLKSRFKHVKEFLNDHQKIWSREVLNSYPNSLEGFLKKWLYSLDQLNDYQLWQVDSAKNYSQIKDPSLKVLFSNIAELSKIDTYDPNQNHISFATSDYQGVKEKKRHEIKYLINYLTSDICLNKVDKIIDIGAGKGHLSRFLWKSSSKKVLSIDTNHRLQEKGKKLISKGKDKLGPDIDFLNLKVNKTNKNYSNLIDQRTLTVGLHTCGTLANDLLQVSSLKSSPYIINFGCCYLRMPPQNVLISAFGKNNSTFPLTSHALTLASRAHFEFPYQDFIDKKRVKSYRYALHLLCYEKLNLKKFIAVGDSHIRDYQKSFGSFATLKLKRLGILHNLCEDEINSFYNEKRIQIILKNLFLANMIRWQFGKIVEIYILLDRAIFLQENGYEAKLMKVFDGKISPRNIAVIGKS